MADRTGTFASAILGGFLAGVSLLTCHMGASAAECLTERRQDTPKGQHWYYHIDHATKRQCWYLRAQEGKLSHATRSSDSSSDPKGVAQQSESTARSMEDARAELKTARSADQNSAVDPAQTARAPSARSLAGSPFPNPPQSDAQDSALSSRWPAPAETTSSRQPPALAADSTDLQEREQATPAPRSAPPPVAANAAAGKPSVSLQMLLVVIFTALALAGLTASVVYSFGRSRRMARLDANQRRAAIRVSFDNAPKPTWAPTGSGAVENSAPQQSEAPRRRPMVQPANRQRCEKIEAILAQLLKQAQESDA
jgi:hypothetical protein